MVAVLARLVTTWVSDVVTGTSNKDRAEMRAIEADPILAFRAPGATLVGQVASVGSNGGVFSFGTPGHGGMVSQEFAIAGDVRDAAAAYQVEADRTGWRLLSARCSVPELTMGISFWRTSNGVARSLVGPRANHTDVI